MYAESRTFKTSDGVELFNAVIRPTKEGKYPTVLLRNPYSMHYEVPTTVSNYRPLNGMDAIYDRWDQLVMEGYALVINHIRGTGNSGGKWEWLVNEDQDGFETMQWLRQQDFYNGEVFRWGGSYLSWTAMMDVYRNYPDLKGMVLVVSVPTLYKLSQKHGFFSTGMMGMTGAMFGGWLGKIPTVNHTIDSWRAFPQKDWCRQIFEQDYYSAISEQQLHPNEDDLYWKESGTAHTLYKSWRNLNIPLLLLTAWYDHSIGSNLIAWDNLPEETRKKSTMFITPFSHSGFNGTNCDWPLPMAGASKDGIAPRYVENWFNFIRGKEPLENLKLNTVAYFPEAGQGIWYFDKGRLQDGEKDHTLYLSSSGKLDAVPGTVTEKTYLYNPYNPACFYGGCGDIESGYMRPGTEMQYSSPRTMHNICLTPQDPPNFRYDVISFLGEPVKEATFLKGASSADIYVKSDCEDTCFYARLYIVKDGVTYALRQDITSLCYQLGDYTPGTEVKLHFDFWPIVWALQPGDYLRLDVTSSCYPMYSVHTNVKAKLQCEVANPKCAHNTVVLGKSTFTYHTSDLSPETTEQMPANCP